MNLVAEESATGRATEERRVQVLASILDSPHLPTPPALALRVVQNASRADCQPKDIAQLLCQDPGLCGKVLKTVNSSLFGLSKPVSSLERAILVLGLRPLRSLVLGLSLPAIQTRNADAAICKYWQESVAGAVIARELAIRLRRPEPEDHLVAGLLRDLGIVVLAQAFPDEYRALGTTDRERFDLMPCDVEEAALGAHHAEVGAIVLESWHLPAEIVLPIRYHHLPQDLQGVAEPIKEQAWLLCLAAQLARAEIVAHYPRAMHEMFELARTRFGIDQAALGDLLRDVTPNIAAFAAVLQVDIGECANLGAILAQASDALVKLSMESTRAASPQLTSPEQGASRKSQAPMASTKAEAPSPCKFRSDGDTSAGAGAGTLTKLNADYLEQVLGGGQLHSYEVLEVIGRGGMGVVLKAFDPALARFVAIKMLLPQLVISSDARKRFEREARSIAAIQHENVVSIHAVSEFNGLPYFVMEYVAGSSLEDHLVRHGALAIPEVIRYGRQIAAGLDAAHSRGVIHRDIKPANILLEERSGLAKLTDFGLARVANEVGLSQQGLIMGTPLYMAPEQFTNDAVDERTDLFSFGSVLYAMCAARPPFEGDSFLKLMRQVCEAKPWPLRSLRQNLPSWLEQLIAKLHAKRPHARCASAAEVVQIFDEHAQAKI